MKKNTKTNRYQFLQREEAWIIRALVTIEKMKNPSSDEMKVIDAMNKTMLMNSSDPYTDTFEAFVEIIKRYNIEDIPTSMMGFTDDRHYTGPGNGDYYRIMKNGKDGMQKRIEARQSKRIKAFEKTATEYDNHDDILGNVAYLRTIKEQAARITVLENQLTSQPVVSVLKPTEHVFGNLEKRQEKPLRKIDQLRQKLKQQRQRDIEFMKTPARSH